MNRTEKDRALILSGSTQIGDLLLLSRVAVQFVGSSAQVDVGYCPSRSGTQLTRLLRDNGVVFRTLPDDIARPTSELGISRELRGLRSLKHIVPLLATNYRRYLLCDVDDIRYLPKIIPSRVSVLTPQTRTDEPFVSLYAGRVSEELGCDIDPQRDVQFSIPDQSRKRVREWLRGNNVDDGSRYAVLNLSTRLAEKNWSIDRCMAVAHTVRKMGMEVICINPPSGMMTDNITLFDDQETGGLPPLADSVALIGRSSLYIGPDTGLTHIAATLRVPVVSMYLEKYHGYWSPTGDSSRIRTLVGQSMADISITDVLRHIVDLSQATRNS